jgi:tetratricopeptide (TPR) repeat protein
MECTTRRIQYVLASVCAALLLVLAPAMARAHDGIEGNDVRGDVQKNSTDQMFKQQAQMGIDAMYNMQFSQALETFDGLITRYPDNPRGYFFRASVFLWRYLFGYSEPDLKRFYAVSEQALQVAETAKKTHPDNLESQVIIGSMYAFRAIANFKSENFIKGTLDMRTCYNYLTEVVKQDPKQYDAYMGLGMFHFVMGALPKSVRTMANLAGMKGDCALGLRELELAAQKSSFAANDAKMCLGMLHIYFNKDYGTGLKYLNEMLTRYPNNVPMLYTLGNVQFFLKKMPYAIDRYKIVTRLADTNFRTFTTFANYRLGEAYFRLNDFASAKVHFQNYLRGPFERSFRASALLRLAMIMEIEGNRDNALKGYRKAADVGFGIEPEDRHAIRRAKDLLKQPLDAVQIQVLRGINCVESSRFQEGEETLNRVLVLPNASPDSRAEAQYFLAEAARRTGRNDEALKHYQAALEARAERETWIPPFCYLQMANIYRSTGNEQLAQAFVQKTRVFSGYDFEEQILFALERDISSLR